MREFDNNENTMNNGNNENNEINENQNKAEVPETNDNTSNAENKDSETKSAQNNSYDQTNAPYNPYFKGYSSNNQSQSNNQNSQGYQNNPYNRDQNGHNQNSYVPNHRYNAPEHSDGQISYTPGKKQKSKSASAAVTKRTLAIVCCAAVVLSALGGFGGAMLANKIADNSERIDAGGDPEISVNENKDSVVVYRSVEEVSASVADSGEALSYSEVAAIVKGSVVEIVTEFNTQSAWYQYVTQGAGSGVIISEDGYIITNTHVITDESTGAVADNITVRLTDGAEYTAQAIGYDSDEDIAVIKIDADGLTPAICGDSEKLAVGEELVVVGNPLGELGGTVTNGIVSATEREMQVSGVKMSLIQTNAAVNPGNSGGGMFNMRGELVGIVNAKSSGTGIEGLGFAIPINRALEVSEQLLEYGYVRGKTMIGVTFRDVSNSNSFFYYYSIKAGVYVESLMEGYNDDVLEVGDRVIAVDGNEISSSSDIKAIVSEASVGDKLKFQLYRDGKLTEVEVTCYEKVPTDQSEINFAESSVEDPVPVPEDELDMWSGNFGYGY